MRPQRRQHRVRRTFGDQHTHDRECPAGLRDDAAGSVRDSEALLQRWHGQGRCSYAVTVRFAPTSTPAQLAMLRELGVHEGQGYLLSRPMGAVQVGDWLAAAEVAEGQADLLA